MKDVDQDHVSLNHKRVPDVTYAINSIQTSLKYDHISDTLLPEATLAIWVRPEHIHIHVWPTTGGGGWGELLIRWNRSHHGHGIAAIHAVNQRVRPACPVLCRKAGRQQQGTGSVRCVPEY